MTTKEQQEAVAIVGMGNKIPPPIFHAFMKHEDADTDVPGCRWPGGVRNAPELWEFLKNQEDAWQEFDDPRFTTRGFHHPNSDRPGTVAMKGAFLAHEDARLFDHSFFGITGLEVETLDPSQRKLLEVTYEALENAGETWESVSGTRTGVFVGNFCLDHWMIQSRDWDNPRPYAFTGAGTSILANRISYIFNLNGPSLTVDTACSSSMYALHLAMNAIRAGDCDAAVVASANWIADPGVQIALDKLGALSASGRCHTFDARAQGYARGEGYGAIYLKRATLAMDEGLPIRALIRGSSMNSNGRTGGITRPSPAGQEAVIREAYRNAGDLPFSDTSYFECHGTGTYVGDPLEVAAVGRVFAGERPSDSPLLVGSVKTNVGHTEGASALASVMKVVLSLEHGAIPPIFDLQTLNPNIDFKAAGVEVVTSMTPWPKDQVRRASINSFGYGGANGHCIIDHVETLFPDYVKAGVSRKRNGILQSPTNGLTSNNLHTNGSINGLTKSSTNGSTNGSMNGASNGATNGHSKPRVNGSSNGAPNGVTNGHKSLSHRPSTKTPNMKRVANAGTRDFVLLPFAAHNKDSLKANIELLASAIEKFPLADVAYTLGVKRSRLPHRTFRIVRRNQPANDLTELGKVLRSPLQSSKIAFVFTGQGAQWAGMGAELFEYQTFSSTVAYLDYILSSLPKPPQWTLLDILSGKSDPKLIQTAEVSQTVCTALQVALVDLLASWAVKPVAVAGHSSGEIGAAYASGHVTAAQAIVAAYFRGQAVARNKTQGLMLAVGLGAEKVFPYLEGREDKVKVAAYNSPGSVTLSGDIEAIREVASALDKDSVFNRELKTGGNAYHSHHMLPLGREYDELLSQGLAHVEKLVPEEEKYPEIPWMSSVTPQKSISNSEVTSPAYWRANLESPVRFYEAIENLANVDDIQVLVEIGPHPALKSPIDQILKKAEKSSIAYASTIKRQQDARVSVLELAGTLFCLNAEVNLAAVNATDTAVGDLEHGTIAIDLPTYQYTYGPVLYHESRQSKEYRYRKVIRHDLLGSKMAGNAKLRPQWRNILRIKDVPWLSDHRLLPDVVFPGAGYIAMAVEAVTRIHNEYPEPIPTISGFSLRDVSIKSSLRIPEDDYGVEVMTSMELVDVATAQAPAWVSFSISSVTRESEEWTEHCTGLIRVEVSEFSVSSWNGHEQIASSFAERPIDTRSWYKRFAAIGLGYGETFQPLSDIRVNLHEKNKVLAKVALRTTTGTVKGGESSYILHPSSLDGAIQLGLVACHSGEAQEANAALVPVHFRQIFLSTTVPADLDHAMTVAEGKRHGTRGAHIDFTMKAPSGHPFLKVEGLRCTSFTRASHALQKAHSSPFTRLTWKPDIRSLSDNQCKLLFPPARENVDCAPLWGVMNKLAHAIVYNIYETFAGENATEPEPQPSGEAGHYFDWIKRRGTLDDNEIRREFRVMSPQERLNKIDELVSQAPDVIEVQTSKLLHDNMADILAQRRTGIDVIISNGLLAPLYEKGLLMTGAHPQFHSIINSLGHANPNMRYFEIGGGTGGATRVAMSALRGPNGIKCYKDYTFTDISPGFLTTAREALSNNGLDSMVFNVLDIEQDPETSGYEPVYDVVVACQVLHATSSMKRTLTHVGKLLKPGGKLILEETTENFIVPAVVVGTFTGYWAGIPDGRVDTPFMDLETWDRHLRAAGFSGTEIVLHDFPDPHKTTSTIVSTFLGRSGLNTNGKASGDRDLQLLYSGDCENTPRLMSLLSHELEGEGFKVTTGALGDASTLSPDSHVVLFLDKDNLQLRSNKEDQFFSSFQQLIRSTASLTVLTSCGIAKGRNPDGALIPGLLRVLKTENPARRFLSIDIDADDFEVPDDNDSEMKSLVRCIVDKTTAILHDSTGQSENGEEEAFATSPDSEFVWQQGCLWVSRLTAVSETEFSVPAAYYTGYHQGSGEVKTEELPIDTHNAVKTKFEIPGVLGSLYFVSDQEGLIPLPKDHVEVRITTIGLDHDDLDNLSGRSDTSQCLTEFVGVITAVGTGVTGDLSIGDRVCGFGTGKFEIGNSTRVPHALLSRIQSCDDDVEIVTGLRAVVSAVFALEKIAHLPTAETWTGKTLVIQSAATSVGLAAIQIAKDKGAQVFAFVNTKEQANSVIRQTNLTPSQVFASRDVGMDLRQAASANNDFNGFDIVLSTSTADLDHLYLTAGFMRPLGHLIHVGRLDDQGQSALQAATSGIGMSVLLQKNATFTPFNLSMLLNTTPSLGNKLLQSFKTYYKQGLLKTTPFGGRATDIADMPPLLTDFAKPENHGEKMVITFKQPTSRVKLALVAPSTQFDSQACYIITGALGGLGQSIVRWMVDRGARNLVLLSRRSITTVPDAQKLVDNLAGRGVNVRAMICDVTDLDQIRQAVGSITQTVKGIVHAAVSWRDLSFDKLSPERWHESLAAKVQGTKNLHEATLGMPLDFFVMTTSLLSVYALATQAAYTAANNFQDAFARYRLAQGLPASTVSFSLIRNLGDTGSDQNTIDTFERNKTLILNEQQFLALFESAFVPNSAGPKIDPLSSANLITCLDPAVMAFKERDAIADTGSKPRWYNDRRLAIIMRAFADAQEYALNQDGQNSGAGSGKSSMARLQQEIDAGIQGGPENRSATVVIVEDAIVSVVASMLFIDAEGVDSGKSVADYGVDSLIAAELRNWFVDILKTDISMLKLLDQSTSISTMASNVVDMRISAAQKGA